MTRDEILIAIKRYFDIDELVCDHVYAKYKQKAWQFLQTDFLHALLIIRRDILQKPMYANGNFKHQRGLRCNMCDLVKTKNVLYLSAHMMGLAGDFIVTGMTAEEARKKIIENASKLPCKIRMEQGVSWVHIDCRPDYGQTEKVRLFKA